MMDTRRTRTVTGLLIGALLLLPALAAAQDARGPRGGPMAAMQGPRIGWLLNVKDELGLSAEQVSRLEAISAELRQRNDAHRAAIQAARADGRLGPAARGPRARQDAEGREEFRRRLREGGRQVTPEQREEMRRRMQEMTPEQREEMRRRMQEMTPEQREEMRRRMQEMTPEERAAMRERMRRTRAGLTEERRQEMRRMMQARRAAIEADPELSAAIRGMRENGRWAMQEVRSVLTAEQLAKARDLVRTRAGIRQGPRRQGDRERR